ncbi:hypothetical protein E3N88_05441 [Mikania micrantha]|uniref:Equilibrative nucleoside transporter n=1 Tax=Mikania micrantha TaxID=192012 RepID=A0A5N6PMV1_9ASTR|nr:hypothetical protein E3N88_05441 [Mikania micrantha]
MEVIRPNEHYDDDYHQEPKDPYHLAYMIHFFLGAGYLIPWNAFITAVDYFQYLYPNKHINKVFSVGYMSAAVTVLLTLMCWTRSNRIKLPSVRTRMNIGQGLFISALMVAPVTDWIVNGNQTTMISNISFVVLVSMVMISGLADGLVGGSLVGATGELPGRYMQAVFAGNATAGTCTHHSPMHHLHQRFTQATVTPMLPEPKTQQSDHPPPRVNHVKLLASSKEGPVAGDRTFNVGDFMGKCLTAIYVPKGSKGTVWCCMGRVVFYPFFVGCIHGPKWMHSEAPVIVLTLMLGVSNGYLTSVLMILAPKSVPIEEAEMVGIAMETFLVIGLVVGSALGWFWNFEKN